jgi:flagellum-specific ATP synthase
MQLEEINKLQEVTVSGTVTAILGMLIECAGIERLLSVGARCRIVGQRGLGGTPPEVLAEVIGFRDHKALLMPFSSIEGIGPGAKVVVQENASACYPCDAWMGRVINPMGEPVDGKGPLPIGGKAYTLRHQHVSYLLPGAAHGHFCRFGRG